MIVSPDIQAALNAALARAQAQQVAPQQSHFARMGEAHQMMQALARAIANQRQPLGKARTVVHPAPVHTNVDGGYSGAGVYDNNGHLVARAGFGPHPVPPQLLQPGMRPAMGVNYVQ